MNFREVKASISSQILGILSMAVRRCLAIQVKIYIVLALFWHNVDFDLNGQATTNSHTQNAKNLARNRSLHFPKIHAN